ncbi:MAG: KH domain-containing protein [Chloroflexi bacterium]|nr:KH domain-containing protein [Chloroflexota bacterium]
MKELVEYVAKELVDDPSQVHVRVVRNSRALVVLELRVAPDDMGRIIGRNGRVANAIRSLLQVMGERRGKRVTLDIV